MSSQDGVFFTVDGDHCYSPRGSRCLDVSLFASQNLNYKYTTVSSAVQDPSGQFINCMIQTFKVSVL